MDRRLRMKWKLEYRYAASREDLPDTFKSELSSLVKHLVSKIWKSWNRQARSGNLGIGKQDLEILE